MRTTRQCFAAYCSAPFAASFPFVIVIEFPFYLQREAFNCYTRNELSWKLLGCSWMCSTLSKWGNVITPLKTWQLWRGKHKYRFSERTGRSLIKQQIAESFLVEAQRENCNQQVDNRLPVANFRLLSCRLRMSVAWGKLWSNLWNWIQYPIYFAHVGFPFSRRHTLHTTHGNPRQTSAAVFFSNKL